MKRRSIVFAAGSLLAAGSSIALKPHVKAAEFLPPINLNEQVPAEFAGWSVDKTIIPVLPDPGVQANLNRIYTQVLARTYISPSGQRVMLSIAYGADQGSDATSAHRPEFCYVAQGFTIKSLGDQSLTLRGHELTVRRLVGTMGPRYEPITYWVTLNNRTVLPGIVRKIEQIKLGLKGQIPDGLLMRTSTVGLDSTASFALQDSFLNDMDAALPSALRSRYFGQAG